MSTRTFTSTAKVQSWDEDRSQTTVPRLTPAIVKMELPELNTTITSRYNMVYLPADVEAGREKEGNAVFTFTDVVEANNFDGAAGTFITQGKGSFNASAFKVQGTFDIVPGSGTGDVGAIFKAGGSGKFESDDTDPHKVYYTFTSQ